MLVEWIVAKIKMFAIFCFKTTFMVCYTLTLEIWSLIIKYPKIWIGMLIFFLSSLLSIKHCKVGFFINYKEHVVNHNYPVDATVEHRYFFNRKMLEEMFKEETKIINDYVREPREREKGK